MAPPRRQRDLSTSQIRSLALLFDDLSPSAARPPRLTDISDGRLWHPDPIRPSETLPGAPRTRLKLVDARPVKSKFPGSRYRFTNQTKAILAFSDPDNTITCIRRKTRREVILARGGSGGKRRPRKMRWWSSVRC